MGLMMSVLVFSVGVLEALACVEHVRQSYLPLDFGRKRRRLVLDVGSGTIRHRETRRSSEFQRDPHVFLRSIQAAVEEEGDEKESEELAAIFQAVEARNIHSTQMMNHQDAVFLTVNDIDDSDSCTSRTSTPNTVIMNMSPELERRSIVELCNIPSDSFSEYSSLQSDELSSDQKDISIAQVDIGQFMCIPEREIPFESIHSNSGEVLQESNTQNESKHAPVCTISTELLANNKYEISERNGILSNVDIQSTDIISIPVKEYGQENAIVVENNKEKSIKPKSDNNCLILDGKNNIDINIVNKNTVSIEPPLTPPISHDTDNGCSKPRNISVLNDENVIQDNSFEINYTMIENSPTLTNTSRVESNNRETIENSKVLVKCQPHSRNEPLIENKGKDEICETQSEQVIESEKQSEKEEILSPKLDTNLVNVAHNIINNKNELGLSKGDSFYAEKQIQWIDQTYAQDDFSESQDSTITPKLKNVSFQKVLLHANELEESEMIPIKLFEIKDQVIEPAVAGRVNSNASYQQIPQPETDSDSEIKITERIDDGQQVSKRLVTHKVQFDMTDPVPTKTDISNEFLKTIDPRIVNQGKELVQEIINQSLIEVNACNSMDYKHVCIDNNSNIVKQTSSDLVERNTTQPENESASQKTKTPNSNETAIIESTLISRESSLIADKNCLKEGVLSSQQERCSEEIPPIDKKSSSQKVIYTVEEESELKKIEEANVNAPNLSESIGEVSKSEEIYDVRHSENTISDIAVIKDELGLEKLGPVIKSEVVEECSHLMDMVHKEETLSCKNDKKEQIISKSIDLKQEQKVGSREEGYSENVVSKDTKLETVCTATRHSMNGSVPNENISQVESVLKEHQVDCHEEVCSDIVVSKDTKVEADVNDTRQPVNGTVPNEDTNHGESISKELQVDRHETICSEVVVSKDTKVLPVVADTKHQKNGTVPDENRSQIESILKNHQVDSHKEVCSEIVVSKDTNVEIVDNGTRHPTNSTESNVQNGNQVESISSNNATRNEVSKTEKLKSSKAKKKRGSKDEITSKDLLDVKESLKPLPQKESANDKGGKPSDQKAMKKDKGVLTKQETLNVSPFRDDVTVLEGGIPSQNQFTPVEDITSPDKAFWLIFSGEYTKAMSKDWHSGHFCCWQCDESLTGQRYVLRDDHPYCIKCYEQVFANTCDECSKVIGIDSKDLSYKDKHWHEACFLCSKCRVSLVDKQFGSKADKIYCGNCYDAQFASRCDGCGQIFRAGTKKMEYKTRQWHEQCFCCCVCKTAIGTKSFIPREQEIYCATCYEEKFATRCVKCNKIITSGGVTYKNEPWHRECFTCTNCSTSLAGQRFTSRDEKPYCAECFGELFAKRCTACCKPITGIGGTRFISFEDRHWHNDCFICASCRSSLVGRGFITDAEDILCTECAKQKLM